MSFTKDARRVQAIASAPFHAIPHDPNERWDIDSVCLRDHASFIRALAKRTMRDVIEIGQRLTICKGHLAHGDWLPWLDREFGWTAKTAERLMQIAEFDKLSNLDPSKLDLPLSGLYIVAQPSTPAEAAKEVIEEAGKRKMSVKDVENIVHKHKPKPKTTTETAVEDNMNSENDAEVEYAKAKSELDPVLKSTPRITPEAGKKKRRTAAQIKSDRFDHAISTFRRYASLIEDFDLGFFFPDGHLPAAQADAAIERLEELSKAAAELIKKFGRRSRL